MTITAPSPTADPVRLSDGPVRPGGGRRPRFSLFAVLVGVVQALLDLALIALAFRAAPWIRSVLEPRSVVSSPPAQEVMDQQLVFAAAQLVAFALYRLYVPRRGLARIDLLFQVFAASSIGVAIWLATTAVLFRTLQPSLRLIVLWWLLAIAFVWLGRVALDLVVRALRRRGVDEERVLIVGAGEQGRLVAEKIEHAPDLGLRVVGYLDDRLTSGDAGRPVLGRIGDLERVVREQGIGEVIVALPAPPHALLLEIAGACTRERVNLQIVPDIFQMLSSEVAVSDLGGLPLMRVRDVALRGWNLMLKRAMDIVVSAVALVLLAPLMLTLAVLVRLSSPGPVFYTQERVGLDGKPFQCLKFRSMRVDAEAETGPVWARPDDDRRTPIGAFMRRWSLDELPQLINVLIGEMSLVGPRPERPYFVEEFARRIPRYRDRHFEKAGMTGWAQVNGLRGQTSIEERTRYDVFYVENWSLAFDVKILLKTLGVIFRDKNAY